MNRTNGFDELSNVINEKAEIRDIGGATGGSTMPTEIQCVDREAPSSKPNSHFIVAAAVLP